MPQIKCIDKKTVHQICSGQVIFDLSIAIKELVENSLDAGPSSIDIKLKEYGLEQVEVIDNGCGVEERDFSALAMKHHTSKLQDFSDLSSVETFGFRGEALSSLCGLCDVTICTKHSSDSVGHRIEYDHNGVVTSQNFAARLTGTTVTLRNIFQSLPVRYKELKKNIKKEYAKVLSLLSAYCIISTDVKISCSNQIGTRKQGGILSTSGSSSVPQNISSVFGSKQLRTLKDFKQTEVLPEVCEEYRLSGKEVETISSLYSISGMISDAVHGNGRSAPDRQFYFINSRPIELPRLAKVVNEVYHSYNRHQFPFVVLNIVTRRDDVDVNVTPDKRQVFLHNEKALLCLVKSSLLGLYQQGHVIMPVTQSTLTASFLPVKKGYSQLDEKDQSDVSLNSSFNCEEDVSTDNRSSFLSQEDPSPPEEIDPPPVFSIPKDLTVSSTISHHPQEKFEKKTSKNGKSEHSSKDSNSILHQEEGLKEETSEKMKHDSSLSSAIKRHSFHGDVGGGEARKRASSSGINFNETVAKQPRIDSITTSSLNLKICELNFHKSNYISELLNHGDPGERDSTNHDSLYKPQQNKGSSSLNDLLESKCQNAESVSSDFSADSEFILDSPSKEFKDATNAEVLKFSMNCLKRLQVAKEVKGSEERSSRNTLSFRAKIETGQNMNAEKELDRNLDKESFNEMIPLGQFNLGFIIAKYGNDLFIIDQHASDEIYNFETLQQTTQMQFQNLVAPQKLDLSPADQLVLSENMEVFRRNGFEFLSKRDEVTSKETHYLTKVPMSRNWQFGSRDVDELIFMLSDSPHVMCRPSRVRDMFASRACRKSVMIGTALSKPEMTRLIKHMSEITHPWNCPHGRPTMRHLIDLSKISTETLFYKDEALS